MRIPRWRGLSVLGVLIVAALAIIPAMAVGAPQDDGRYIVVFEDSVDRPGDLAHAQVSEADGDMTGYFRTAVRGYAAILPKDEVDELRDDPRVKYVTVDHKFQVQAQEVPTGIQRTFASTNKALDIDGQDDLRADVDVAVLDTGIDASHPDLNVVARVDCVGGGGCKENSGTYSSPHGTHVAGTIGALDNGIGVVGVAPGARLWSVKVIGDDDLGWESDIVSAVEWVTAHASQIEVGNMSFACPCVDPVLNPAINQSVEAGLVYAVAAGNDGKDASAYSPASNPNVITVSAEADYNGKPGGGAASTCLNAGPDDTLATFSNYGSPVDIAAPGVCIESTVPGNKYENDWSGTSMAAPHVAGAAALLAIQSNPATKAGVEALRSKLIAAGNLAWTDTSPDGIKERLLDLSNETTFKLPSVPIVSTGSATGISETGATLPGTINPNGFSTTYHFEYGPTASYGTSVPVPDASLGGGTSPVSVSRVLTGLTSGTAYHYRLVATNVNGTIKGADREFKTKGWYVASTPNPPGSTSTSLADVSCYSVSGCMAAGSSNSNSAPLALSFNGSSWLEIPVGSGWRIESTSCPNSGICMAVGQDNSSVWKEGYFSPRSFQIPYKAEDFVMHSVSCDDGNHCVAVGSYTNEAGVPIPAVQVWDGTAWKVQAVPTPGGNPSLYGVSCTSSSFCMTVGPKSNAAPITAFAMKWNGTSWQVQTVPAPAGASAYVLWDVSCASATKCVAVGFKTVNQQSVPYAIGWNGTSWSEQVPKNPGGGELWSVSCGSASCTAVGRWVLEPGIVRPLMEVWNGTEWTLQTLPVPTPPAGGKVTARLWGVSCVAESCTGAGSYSNVIAGQTGGAKTYVVRKQQ